MDQGPNFHFSPLSEARVDRPSVDESVSLCSTLPNVMAAAATDDPPDSLTVTASPLAEDATATIIAASFDPTLLTAYLADLAVVALNASREDLRLSLLSYPDTLQRCSRFSADPNSLVLYLRKETGDTGSQLGTLPTL